MSILPSWIIPTNQPLSSQNSAINFNEERLLKLKRALDSTQVSTLKDLRNHHWASTQLKKNFLRKELKPSLDAILFKNPLVKIGGFALPGEHEPYSVRVRIPKHRRDDVIET